MMNINNKIKSSYYLSTLMIKWLQLEFVNTWALSCTPGPGWWWCTPWSPGSCSRGRCRTPCLSRGARLRGTQTPRRRSTSPASKLNSKSFIYKLRGKGCQICRTKEHLENLSHASNDFDQFSRLRCNHDTMVWFSWCFNVAYSVCLQGAGRQAYCFSQNKSWLQLSTKNWSKSLLAWSGNQSTN